MIKELNRREAFEHLQCSMLESFNDSDTLEDLHTQELIEKATSINELILIWGCETSKKDSAQLAIDILEEFLEWE